MEKRRSTFLARAFLALALCSSALVSGLGASVLEAAAPNGTGLVWLLDIKGAIGPASADQVERTIDDAHSAGAVALILRIDTPGGLDKAMRSIVSNILSAPIPIISYVAPNGARAASAGTYIAMASHVSAMAPATNIGSSTPVSIGISPTLPSNPATDPKPGSGHADAMTNKIVNDAVAYLQGLAELRGRNIDWAEKTVRDEANIRASEALDLGVIELIATDIPALLSQLDGRKIELEKGPVVLQLSASAIYQVEADWRHELLEVITDPAIAYGFLIFGIYGILLEFYNPGMIFPAAIGAILLLLGAYGLQMLPINYAGLALILLGIVMMVFEVVTPTLGILGVAGVISFVAGSIILMDTKLPGPVHLLIRTAIPSTAVRNHTHLVPPFERLGRRHPLTPASVIQAIGEKPRYLPYPPSSGIIWSAMSSGISDECW